MRVKINDTWYDSGETPICIQYSEKQKHQIYNNGGANNKYAAFPDDWGSPEEMIHWMSEYNDL